MDTPSLFYPKTLSKADSTTYTQYLTMFNRSACDVHLKLDSSPDATYLVAIANNDEGAGIEDEILLDRHIGNKDG